MIGRDRIGWLVLLGAASALGVLEMRPPPPGKAPLGRMSIRITVAAEGSVRIEAPDGTDATFAGPATDEFARRKENQLRLAREVSRLDPSADPDRLFEIVVDPVVPFERFLWVQQSAFGPRYPRVRRFVFSLLGARDAGVPFVWTSVNEQGPGTPIIPLRMPMVKVRLTRSPSDTRAPASLGATLTMGTGALHGAHPNDEFGAWTPIAPGREATRDWVLNWKNRPPEVVGAVEREGGDLTIPFGAVFEVLRGFVDAGLWIDLRVDG